VWMPSLRVPPTANQDLQTSELPHPTFGTKKLLLQCLILHQLGCGQHGYLWSELLQPQYLIATAPNLTACVSLVPPCCQWHSSSRCRSSLGAQRRYAQVENVTKALISRFLIPSNAHFIAHLDNNSMVLTMWRSRTYYNIFSTHMDKSPILILLQTTHDLC
jgi:hypothetical protein